MRQPSAALAPIAAAARAATSIRRLRVAGSALIGAAAVSVVGDLGAVLALRAAHALTPAATGGLNKALIGEGPVALAGVGLRFRATENEEIAQARTVDSGQELSAG